MTGIQEAEIEAVIDRFYEAAAQPHLWPAALQEASRSLDAEGVLLLAGPNSSLAPLWTESLDEPVAFGIREGWFDRNPRVSRGLALLKSGVDILTEENAFSPDEVGRVPFNAEFVHRFGLGPYAAFTLVRDAKSPVYLSLERHGRQGPYADRELRLIERMLPHLQRAGSLARHVAAARASGMLDAFEAIGCGGVLLDARGEAIRLNEKARRMLRLGAFAVAHGQISAREPAANARLKRLVGSVVRPGQAQEAIPGDAAVALPRAAGRPLIAHAAPIVRSGQEMFGPARAILMIVDPDEHADPASLILRQAFGLSPAEARLAGEIARGLDLKEIASSHGVSEGTVRAQLKAIFSKTDTHRQAELASLIARVTRPALVRAEPGSSGGP